MHENKSANRDSSKKYPNREKDVERMGVIPGNSGVATQFIANGFNMPKFNTVKFNALPHHSPCAVLVTSDCCHLYARTGRNHTGSPVPSAPSSPATARPGTSSPISFSGGIVRAYDHRNDNGHTSASWTNAVLRRADTQEPMGRLDASQLGGIRIESATG
ncbi:hypothetical protein NWF34_07695 [Gordonia sp. GONU]|uniref:hypothetical protein n=1 Tax=Gordonia TaxID=2053 RepID=UPI0021AC17CD|nr:MULTISPECIES: hypothetical protein [Gordonia]MCR8896841.1 hypothetical protein [Gordonia sp. GONU]MCZ4579292.1 hypothetical protein [Gordonia amicalis]